MSVTDRDETSQIYDFDDNCAHQSSRGLIFYSNSLTFSLRWFSHTQGKAVMT